MKKYRRPKWHDSETTVYLKSWKKHAHLSRFFKKRCSRIPLYYQIKKDIQKYGFVRSMTEIQTRMRTLKRRFSEEKQCGGTSYKFYKEIEEILEIEKKTIDSKKTTADQMQQTIKLIYEPYIKGDISDFDNPAPIQSQSDHSDSMSDTGEKLAKPEMPKTTANILRKFLREFQKTNIQLEANDSTILRLFREQNNLFKSQTSLLTKLVCHPSSSL